MRPLATGFFCGLKDGGGRMTPNNHNALPGFSLLSAMAAPSVLFGEVSRPAGVLSAGFFVCVLELYE